MTDKQAELITDAKGTEVSECCGAPVGGGRCWDCKEAVVGEKLDDSHDCDHGRNCTFCFELRQDEKARN